MNYYEAIYKFVYSRLVSMMKVFIIQVYGDRQYSHTLVSASSKIN